jgi:hypothetical protein
VNESGFLQTHLRMEQERLGKVLEDLQLRPRHSTIPEARYLAWTAARILKQYASHQTLLPARMAAVTADTPGVSATVLDSATIARIRTQINASIQTQLSTCIQAARAPLETLQAALTDSADADDAQSNDMPGASPGSGPAFQESAGARGSDALPSPQLTAAVAASMTSLSQLLTVWKELLEPLTALCYRAQDWQRVSHLNADVILEERRLYKAMTA